VVVRLEQLVRRLELDSRHEAVRKGEPRGRKNGWVSGGESEQEMKNANQCFGQRGEQEGLQLFKRVIKPGLVEVLFGPGIAGAGLKTLWSFGDLILLRGRQGDGDAVFLSFLLCWPDLSVNARSLGG
jgi:hypothetical protein